MSDASCERARARGAGAHPGDGLRRAMSDDRSESRHRCDAACRRATACALRRIEHRRADGCVGRTRITGRRALARCVARSVPETRHAPRPRLKRCYHRRTTQAQAGAANMTTKANSTELAYRELRRRIIESELTPGSHFLEQELGLMLGFSRTPIREAAIRLQGEGLVQIVPRHGIRIVPTSISD